MNKISYYAKRPYHNIHANYTGYIHPYKKSYFKNRPKLNNIPINNNNYLENRNKNYYYNNNFNYFNNSFTNFSENQNFYHSPIFQKNRFTRKNVPHFTEEKKICEEIVNDSVNEEVKKEEVLKIRVNVNENETKELILYVNDDINEKVEDFCKENSIDEKLVGSLVNKINQSLSTLEVINNMTLNETDYLLLEKIKNKTENDENN